jgi:acylphosphatase
MSENTARLHAVVQGHVQGVGFRYFVSEKAKNLSIKGWVRNTFKGEVEVMAEGNRKQLEELLAALRQGPSISMVVHVSVEWLEAEGKFTQFSLAQTA